MFHRSVNLTGILEEAGIKKQKTSIKKVLFVTHVMPHYRVAFHELVRKELGSRGIIYDVVCGLATDEELKKGDIGSLDSMLTVPEFRIINSRGVLLYHPIYLRSFSYDLVIVTQENKYLLNYALQLSRPFRRGRLAFMGHGRNFQARNFDSIAERWKRFWATKVDWWFAYTEETRDHIRSLGFSDSRITVINNSVDLSKLRDQIAQITPERLELLRRELDIVGRNVGVFVGGLYPDKRLNFLVEAGRFIRTMIPDFELLVIGGGQDLQKLEQLAADLTWIRILGPRFGTGKVELMLLGQVFMMPGLVGLAILDAGATRLPIATTDFPWHSPEISYLKPGENGLLVEDWQNPVAYGQAVVDLLKDKNRLEAMANAAEAMSRRFSIEAMAQNFACGIFDVLKE